MYHQTPVNPALRIHVQGQPGLYEFEAIWPLQGQPISKIQKEISDKNLNHRTVRTFKAQAEL